MGRIATVISSERTTSEGAKVLDVTVDPGGGAKRTAQHFADSGDDAAPLPEDFCALEQGPGSGVQQITGYADPRNEGKALPGEKRVYSRDVEGNPVAEVWLKRDGSVQVESLAGGMVFSIDVASSTIRVQSAHLIMESDDILLGNTAGRPVACVGDLVAVNIPAMVAGASPVTPVPPATPTASGGIAGAGQIISGDPGTKGR